jgi:RNA polymerase sigma-70 factor (ECF subfamily)
MSAGPVGAATKPAAVLVAAQAGEAWALRAVYDDLAPRVAGYLRARGAAEAADLTSEVFLAVFARLGSVTGGYAGLRTLVFSIAHARLVDSLRARARQPDVLPYDPGSDRRTTASAEDTALLSLGAERAAALLNKLPARQRDVLMLRVLGDLTVEQVAQTLGTTEGAVKQLQRRGLITLRALVAAGGVTL